MDFLFEKAAVTRFSHDMAGAVGSVANSIALLAEDGGADADLLKLAEDNANILMGRLRFFRAAYGNDGPLASMDVAGRYIDDYLATLENRGISYVCERDADDGLPLFAFRMILLAVQIAADATPRGAKIVVTARAGTDVIRVDAVGKAVKADADAVNALNGKTPAVVSHKAVPAVLLKKSLDDRGGAAEIETGTDLFSLVLTTKR